jgi:hypothetical protein
MRMQKISALTFVAVAAGLALTACDPSGDGSVSASGSSASSAAAGGSGPSQAGNPSTGGSASSKGGSASSTGAGGGAAQASSGSMCRTANLSFSLSGGMAEGDMIVNMRNTGSGTCTMHGFPGVDLKSADGTISAERNTQFRPSDVRLAPGQETHFDLDFPPNNGGGTGVTFTGIVVTPPNETHSRTIAANINVPLSDSSAGSITVNPVGAGK